ncbi:MAG TPA: hypothetical protein VN812_01675 [Candidatus Acidoferrales bacterium]|nr:hypothetical protein [Candidatus Acidoferrales bacterium]
MLTQLCDVCTHCATHCGSFGITAGQASAHVLPFDLQAWLDDRKAVMHGWAHWLAAVRAVWQVLEVGSVAHAVCAACSSVLQVDCTHMCAVTRAALLQSRAAWLQLCRH